MVLDINLVNNSNRPSVDSLVRPAEKNPMDCIFCDILTAKLEATFVYRDDPVAAFMDIQPVNPGHMLVVPVQHLVGLADLPSDRSAAG